MPRAPSGAPIILLRDLRLIRGAFRCWAFLTVSPSWKGFASADKPPIAGMIVNLLGYNVRDRLVLGEARAFAVEIAVPINQWTIKGEFAYVQSQADIGVRTNRAPECLDP